MTPPILKVNSNDFPEIGPFFKSFGIWNLVVWFVFVTEILEVAPGICFPNSLGQKSPEAEGDSREL